MLINESPRRTTYAPLLAGVVGAGVVGADGGVEEDLEELPPGIFRRCPT
jgi:hypothetical protein